MMGKLFQDLPKALVRITFGLTCGPESATGTRQNARQPPTVKLARVRRATVGGDRSTDERKASRFKPELCGSTLRVRSRQSIEGE